MFLMNNPKGPGESGNTNRYDQEYDSSSGSYQEVGEQILSKTRDCPPADGR